VKIIQYLKKQDVETGVRK